MTNSTIEDFEEYIDDEHVYEDSVWEDLSPACEWSAEERERVRLYHSSKRSRRITIGDRSPRGQVMLLEIEDTSTEEVRND